MTNSNQEINNQKKRQWIVILSVSIFVLSLTQNAVTFAQKSFKLTDTTFEVGDLYRADLIFDLSFPIHKSSFPTLDSIAGFLFQNPEISIEIGTNTDFRAGNRTSDTITDYRAHKLWEYFISKGVDSTRITYKGYGADNPIVVDEEIHKSHSFLQIGQPLTETYIKSLSTKEEQEAANILNGRTEIRIIKKRKR